MSEIRFRNAAHRDFFLESMMKCRVNDCYHRAFFYVMGIAEETRKNINSMFDLSCIDCVYPIIHIVAPFLKKETELLTVLLYRQQPRKSMMWLEKLTPRLPLSAACRRTCGTPHKAAVPVPGVWPLPAPV